MSAKHLLLLPLLLASLAWGYVTDGRAPLPAGTFTFQLQLQSRTSGTLLDGNTTWNSVARDALSEWNLHLGIVQFAWIMDSNAPVNGSTSSTNGYNNVTWGDTVYGESWGSMGGDSIGIAISWASSSERVEGDVIFNSNAGVSWDSYRGNLRGDGTGHSLNDLRRVALHEFGHVLGLSHPDVQGQSVLAVMNSIESNVDTLTADDIAGADSIYGSAQPPVITKQPTANQAIEVGGNALFTVEVSGTAPFSYQWYKNDVALSGSSVFTSWGFTLNNCGLSNSGTYKVKVTNAAGSVWSNDAVLTVGSSATPPSITTHPASLSVNAGSPASFSVAASGTAPLSYQWKKDGTAIPGATASSFTIASTKSSDAGSYSVTVSNSAGSATSNTASLNVTVVSTAPSIILQPQSQLLVEGGSASLDVTASGTAPLAYQWKKDGNTLPGATASSLSFSKVAASDAGSYSVTVSNSAGSVTSSSAQITVESPPLITGQPSARASYQAGESLSLAVTATGLNLSYQWRFNGASIPGATTSSYSISSLSTSDTGSYEVRVFNRAGSVSSSSVSITVTAAPALASRISNLSSRTFVGTGDAVQIAGFVISGSKPKAVLIRASGPAIAALGVAGTLPDPILSIINQADNSTLYENDNWYADSSSGARIRNAAASLGAFEWTVGSKDAALLVTLPPGGYTAMVKGAGNGTGVALVEVYEADSEPASHLSNISTRSPVNTGDAVQIAGFVISGNKPKAVLIRASGPALDAFLVAGTLKNPVLELNQISSPASLLQSNDDWGATQASTITAAAARLGAFPWTTGSKDAALLVTLNPGVYSATVKGASNSTGVALIEVYDAD